MSRVCLPLWTTKSERRCWTSLSSGPPVLTPVSGILLLLTTQGGTMNKHKALPLLICGNFQVWTLPRASYNFHSDLGLRLSRIPCLSPTQHCCCIWRARYSSCLGGHRSARASWRGHLEVGLGFLCIVRKSPQVFLMCPLGAASLLRIPELER